MAATAVNVDFSVDNLPPSKRPRLEESFQIEMNHNAQSIEVDFLGGLILLQNGSILW
jgi:hypothetical protein